jgi:hypothetical protein
MTLTAPRETQALRTVRNSLGLNALLNWVRDDRSYSILDLGPALATNVRFWSQFSCRLYIHDFYRSFREWKAAVGPKEEPGKEPFSALLRFSDETVFDMILAWDIFNYFNLRDLEALVQRLSRWCRPGTRLFALTSSLPKISASPTMFSILNREQLVCEIPTLAIRPGPRHQPRDIVRLMAGFTVSSSFLSRQGIQEYVFAFK